MRTGRPAQETVRSVVLTAGRVVCVIVVAAVSLGVGRGWVGQSSSWVWLAATAVVAATVILTRGALERLADRVVYGANGDPYAQLSQFVRRISGTLAVDDVLPHVARTVTTALHRPRGEVRLWLAGGEQWRQTWPAGLDDHISGIDVPLRHHGEQVGSLGVDTTASSLSSDERALLDRLAGTAGLALANVRLTFDLRRRLEESRLLAGRLELSRERLLNAAAQETQRFSDLVDREVQARLSAVESLLARTDASPSAAIDAATNAVTEALAALREISAGVFPPALPDRGLADALDMHCQRYGGRVRIRRSQPTGRKPLPVEAAAYFCAAHAIDGGVQHGSVDLDIYDTDERLQVQMTLLVAPEPAIRQLLEDRLEASDADLDVATEHDRCCLTMTWDLTGSKDDGPAVSPRVISATGQVGHT